MSTPTAPVWARVWDWIYGQAYVLLLLATFAWGGNGVAGKLAVGTVPPFTLTSLRWSMVILILFWPARHALREQWPVVRKNWKLLTFLGLTGFVTFNFSFYIALHYTTAINATIEQSAMPIVVILVAFFVLGERITPMQLAGIIVSMIGVTITVARGDLLSLMRLEVSRGDAIMMIAVISYSVYSVFLRFRPELDWRVMMIALAAAAFLASLPFSLWEVANGNYPEASMTAVGVVTFTVLGPSLMAQVFFIRAIELIGPNRSGVFFNLVPIFGALLAILILGEAFRAYHAAGLAMVIGGIMLAEYSGRRKEKAAG